MTIFFSVYPIELDYESIFKSLRILGIDYCIQANWKTNEKIDDESDWINIKLSEQKNEVPKCYVYENLTDLMIKDDYLYGCSCPLNIESLNRTFNTNFELIIVDDNSSYDNNINNKNVIESFCDDRIKYIHLRKNKKQCHARNVGLKVCSGNWIRYLDDDDYLLDNSLQEYYDFIVKNPNKKVFTTKYLCNNDIEGINFNQIENIFDNWNVDTCCIIHHIDCYKKLGGWSETLQVADDYEFILRYVINYIHEYKFIDKVLAKFDFNEETSYLSNKDLNCLNSLNYIYSEFCNDNKIMKLLIVNVDMNKLINCLYSLKCFFKIDLKNEIDEKDLYEYDYIYKYGDGSLLKNVTNLTYHQVIENKIQGKDIWICNKKRKIK